MPEGMPQPASTREAVLTDLTDKMLRQLHVLHSEGRAQVPPSLGAIASVATMRQQIDTVLQGELHWWQILWYHLIAATRPLPASAKEVIEDKSEFIRWRYQLAHAIAVRAYELHGPRFGRLQGHYLGQMRVEHPDDGGPPVTVELWLCLDTSDTRVLVALNREVRKIPLSYRRHPAVIEALKRHFELESSTISIFAEGEPERLLPEEWMRMRSDYISSYDGWGRTLILGPRSLQDRITLTEYSERLQSCTRHMRIPRS